MSINGKTITSLIIRSLMVCLKHMFGSVKAGSVVYQQQGIQDIPLFLQSEDLP